MKKRGFTLIELLIVVSVIGILSIVSITAYVGMTLKAARSEAYSNLTSLRLLQEQRFADSATYTANIAVDLPRFQPGAGAQFTYAITSVADGVGLPAVVPVPYTGATFTFDVSPTPRPCFIATATGIAGTRVCRDAANCDVFAIDCNNNRNF